MGMFRAIRVSCWTVASHKRHDQTTSNEVSTRNNQYPMTHAERHKSNRKCTTKMRQHLVTTPNANPLPQKDTRRTAAYHSPNHPEHPKIRPKRCQAISQQPAHTKNKPRCNAWHVYYIFQSAHVCSLLFHAATHSRIWHPIAKFPLNGRLGSVAME